MLMTERGSHAAEPPASVAAAMAAADVVLCPTVQSLSHTAARREANEAGARIATLPGVTEELLARVMSADMEGLRRKGEAIAEMLTAGSEARITCANGSDLRLGLGRSQARSPTPATSRRRAPSATCRAARASSPRLRALARGRLSSTARSRRSGRSPRRSS